MSQFYIFYQNIFSLPTYLPAYRSKYSVAEMKMHVYFDVGPVKSIECIV